MKGAIKDQQVADPGIRFGPLRILRRTDGKCIVYDNRRPMGRMDVFVSKDVGPVGLLEAVKEGERLHALERRPT